MARQVLPIAGQIIGGMIGGPVGAAIGGAIGSAVGQYVDPIRHQGPKLGEARAQTAQEGVYRPLVFGTGCVSGNVIHRSPRKVVRHRESAGGKGNRDTVDSDRGYRTFAIRIAEAHTPEGYALLRIWENETLVYDVRPESEIVAESHEYAEKFRFYAGTQDQLPDPDLEAYLGVGNVNSYRGSCYIVFGNFDLTDYGDMVPQYRFEVASEAVTEVANAMILQQQVVGPNIVLGSPDSIDWSGSWNLAGDGNKIIHLGGNRFMVYGPSGSPEYTDDHGLTWATSTGEQMGGSGGMREACYDYDTGMLLFPGGLEGLRVSMDRGESISLGGNIRSSLVRKVAGGWVSYYGGSAYRLRGSSDGYSWSEAIPTPDIGAVESAVSTDYMVYIGGRTPQVPFLPKVLMTQDGLDYSHETIALPGVDGTIVSMAYGKGKILAITSGGGLLVRDSGGWRYAGSPFPNPPKDIAFSGNVFIAVGNSSGPWFISTSTDGDSWTVRRTGNGANQIRIAVGRTPQKTEGGRVPLSYVVEFCHQRIGQRQNDFDVSDLDDDMDGVVFADGYTARDAIMSLLPIYNADASEHDRGSGYRINYIKRGAPVVLTLTIDDLVDEPEETVREDPMERPRVLHMAFESPVTGYTAGKASIQRLSPDVKLVNEVSTYVPVTFKDVDEAWQRADVQMRVAWTEVHGERKFSIPDSHIDLVPTDNVALSLRGQVQRLRLLKNEYADGVMKLESVADRQSNYTSHVTGIPLPAPEKPPPSLMGPAALAILDIPAISDQHDRLGYYVAVTGTADAFAGAVVQRQQNGAWADVVSIGRSQRATMGVLENTVSAGSEHYTDTTNTVSVTLYMDAELESLSNAQWLNKGGAFALETATGWEIMQYRDAYQDSGGVWHLTHLARGRLNTTPDEHLPGARFVMLSGAQFIDADVGMIDQPLTLRAAAVGRSPETAVPETITYQGNSQREFPVAELTVNLNGITLEMSAIPRDRFGTEQHPVRSANHDGFRWAATDGSDTVTADSDHATASLDVSGLSAPITATVAQLNRFTGVGPTVSEQAE